MKQQIISAKYIMPFPGKILQNHYITVVDGRITGIAKFHTLKTTGTQTEFISLGNSVLMPGFVNAHVHLELCGDNYSKDYPSDYFSMIGRTKKQKRFNKDNPFALMQNLHFSIDKLVKGGTTCIGNYTMTAESSTQILDRNLSAVEFIETNNWFADNTNDAYVKVEELRKAIKSNVAKLAEKKKIPVVFETGIAPRNLYSSNQEFLDLIFAQFVAENVRFSTHISEHESENRLFQLGDGELFDYVTQTNNLQDYMFPPAASAVQYFSSLLEDIDKSKLNITPMIVHANFIDKDDIAHLVDLKASVVFCPSTHSHYFREKSYKYNFKQLLDNSIPVALGSDSTIVNSNLSMLDEMRLLSIQYPEISVVDILRMATTNGAKALNLTESAGVLSVGRPADIIAIEIPENTEPEDVPAEIVRGTGDVKMTIIKGHVSYQKPIK